MKYIKSDPCYAQPEEKLNVVDEVLLDAIERAGGLSEVRIVSIDDPDKNLAKD